MAREIERKFLTVGDEWRAAAVKCETMRQGYIASGALSVRVRIGSADRAWLNIKSGRLAAARAEFEYPIPVRDAEELLELSSAPLIEKTRHWVEHEGFEWEVDEFHGRNAGLVVAELELEDEAQAFPKPPWAGTEVTDRARYYNVSLIERPYSDWGDAERNGD